jgi:hypothetical protein
LKKYNIALLPIFKENEFIGLSQKIPVASAGYILGEFSIPHITICQFHGKESEIDNIWIDVDRAINDQAMVFEFTEISCMTFDNLNFWVSLIPDNVEQLNDMHAKVANLVKTSTMNNYDPHLTLINTLDFNYKNKIKVLLDEYNSISDCFILSLGECDSLGQFTKILKQSEINQCSALKF